MSSSLVSRIPSAVFARSTQSASRTFIPNGQAWDFAIAGLPFNGAASEQRPLVRQTAPTRKEQTDTTREPGEHSLAFWWSKAQSSFHGGAGQKYLTNSEDNALGQYRFQTSTGLDVFSEPGRASLIPSTFRVVSSAGTPLIAVSDNGNLYIADGATLARHYMYPVGGQPDSPTSSMNFASDPVSWGAAAPILSLATSGDRYFVATDTGVYTGTGTGASTKIYNFAANSKPLLRYVKQRLILALAPAGGAAAVYELDPTVTTATALPTAIFSVPKGYWRWTAVAESPSAILISGDNEARSAVYSMRLDTSGPVPVLAPGVVSAEFPPGELVLGLETYLGTVIGVQSTAGFRMGVLSADGDFRYGALLLTHAWGYATGAMVGAGNSLYVGWRNEAGEAGLARVDLTESLGNTTALRFPWASDMRAFHNGAAVVGTVSAAALWDYDRKVIAVPGQGVFVQTHLPVASGTLTTSRIRFDTLEPKVIRFLRVRGEGTSGRVSVEIARDSDTNFTSIGAIDILSQTDSGDMYVHVPPAQYIVVRVTVTGGASLAGYQIKALPAQRRQRFLQLPLNCFDREIDNSGQIVGGDGTAMERLLSLERLEQTGDIVALQWLSAHPSTELTEYVTIEQIEFAQTSGPSDRRGWGGVVTLTLRTVG